MPRPVRYGSLPFEEQIEFFRNKLNIPTERWNDIWKDGHNSGFMVAGALTNDLLNDFRKSVDMAIAEGKSIGWFKQAFNDIVAKHGWSFNGNADWRAKVIYETNMRQSYNAGRFEQLQHFEIWEYQHGDSLHPRLQHLAWHNLRLPKEDSFWLTHFPINGWGCKCRVRGRTQAWMDRHGFKIDKSPVIDLVEWTDKKTGEIHWVPKGIDAGFDYAPRKQKVTEQQRQLAKDKASVYQAPTRLIPTTFSTVKQANVHTLNAKLDEFKSAKPRLEKLSEFIKVHDIKTLFIKEREMKPNSAGAKKVLTDILNYLPVSKHRYRQNNFTINVAPGYNLPNGWTSSSLEHVIIKVANDANFNKVQINELINAVELATAVDNDKLPLTLSAIVRRWTDSANHGGAMVTWLHELGHQVYFKSGSGFIPFDRHKQSLTTYATTSIDEWHAEHFAAWVLNREALAKWNSDIAVYFDNLIEKAMKWQP